MDLFGVEKEENSEGNEHTVRRIAVFQLSMKFWASLDEWIALVTCIPSLFVNESVRWMSEFSMNLQIQFSFTHRFYGWRE